MDEDTRERYAFGVERLRGPQKAGVLKMTCWKNFRSYLLIVVPVLFSLAPAFAQTLLQITSPVAAISFPLFTEGRTYTIGLSADPSVHNIAVLAQWPLGDAKPTSNPLEFTLTLATNIPPGIYSIGAMGFTSRGDVESEPVLIDVERADTPISLSVHPIATLQGPGDHTWLEVNGKYADGTKLCLSNSTKLSYHSNDTSIVSVRGQHAHSVNGTRPQIGPLTATAVGAGTTTIVLSAGEGESSVSAAIFVTVGQPPPTGPPPEIDSVTPETGVPGVTDITIRGRHFGETQGNSIVSLGNLNGIVKHWTDTEILATVDEHAHRGEVSVWRERQHSNAIPFTPAGLFIDAISGMPTPGNQINIHGSGFESEWGSGYVTIADIKAQVVQWSSTEIIVTVPDFSPTGWTFQLAVHQDGKSAEFRLISPQKSAVK